MNLSLETVTHQGLIVIKQNGNEIGQLRMSTKFEEKVKDSIKTHDDLELLEKYEQVDNNIIVNSIGLYITEQIESRGEVAKEALKALEEIIKPLGYSKIIFLVNKNEETRFEEIGYKVEGGLDSTKQTLLCKSVQ